MSDKVVYSLCEDKVAKGEPERVGNEFPWSSLVLLLLMSVLLWVISGLLPPGAHQPILRADTFDNWFIFGQRILHDSMRAVSILLLGIFLAVLVPGVGLWIERLIFNSKRWKFLAMVSGLVVLTSALFSYIALDHFPHIPDEIAMIFQAKVLLSGRLFAEVPELSRFFEQEFIVMDGTRWYGKYFIGPSLAYIPGVWAGAVWMVNPILAGFTMWLMYALGHSLFNEKIGRLAALLMALSPFRISLFAIMMAHPVCLLALGIFTLGVIKVVQHPERVGWALTAGAAMGFAVNCRPLTALAMGLVIGSVALWVFPWRRFRWQTFAAFVFPLVIFAGVFLGYNKALTNDALLTPFNKWSPKDRLGFGDDVGLEYWPKIDRVHSLRKGLWKHGYQNLDALGSYLTGWGHVTLLLMVLSLFCTPWPKRTWALAAVCLGLAFAYLFYVSASVLAGQARYLSESMPMMILLVTVTLVFIRRRLPWICRWMGLFPAVRTGRSACWLAGLLLVLWSIPRAYSPLFDECRGGFFGQDASLRKIVKDNNIENALIFVETGHFMEDAGDNRMDEYGAAFTLNDPDLQGSVVYARDLGDELNAQLMALYPGRNYYHYIPTAFGTDECFVEITNPAEKD